MMDNHLYNLLKQLVQEHKSLWRITNNYKSDAGECADCKSFWGKLESAKESVVGELEALVKAHLS